MPPFQNFALDLDLGHLFRESTPLRVAFLHPLVARGGPGPLSAFVRQRRAIALDLLLFAHTTWPLRDAESISAPSAAWADAIGIGDKPSYRAIISRSWTWLEQSRLIRTAKEGKKRAIEIRREDGSGAVWTRPSEKNEPFFHLPIGYWTGGFSRDLSLPAKAVLLIGLSLQSGDRSYFELPVERGASWYGMAPQSVRTGLQDLREVGLLRTWVEKRTSDRSPLGHTFDRRHSLNSLETVGSGRIRRGETNPSAGKIFEEIPF
jgi:hypothetical protein